jgi:hypothetical protein
MHILDNELIPSGIDVALSMKETELKDRVCRIVIGEENG